MDKIAQELAEAEFTATKIMFRLKDEYSEFTADDFYRLAREAKLSPQMIKKFSGGCFKAFKAAGYITKTKQFRLSTRNQSSPLPVWASTKQSEKQTLPELQKAQ